MHNLHFIVVKADSAEDAIGDVETFIEDFGNENNWRTICGCVSDKNEVFDAKDGRYRHAHMGYTTIEKINEVVEGWINSPSIYAATALEKIKSGDSNFENWNSHELFSMQSYIEGIKHRKYTEEFSTRGEKFDVLKHEYKEGIYDDYGVTQCPYGEGENVYVVFVDMHS